MTQTGGVVTVGDSRILWGHAFSGVLGAMAFLGDGRPDTTWGHDAEAAVAVPGSYHASPGSGLVDPATGKVVVVGGVDTRPESSRDPLDLMTPGVIALARFGSVRPPRRERRRLRPLRALRFDRGVRKRIARALRADDGR